MIKDPGPFIAAGARLPSGLLMVGPPGTGKTLMARVMAAEAGVPVGTTLGAPWLGSRQFHWFRTTDGERVGGRVLVCRFPWPGAGGPGFFFAHDVHSMYCMIHTGSMY